jgi:hypothetical protein
MVELILISFLDPFRALITSACIPLLRSPWVILLAGAVSAIAAESILSAAVVDRAWGEGFIEGAIGSLMQAAVLYWIVGRIRWSRQRAHGATQSQ